MVNDPAGADDSSVRLHYLIEELDAAWRTSGRTTYIVHDRVPGDGTLIPEILGAVLEPTGNTKTLDGKTYSEYMLKHNGEAIDLSMAVVPEIPNYERGISIMLSRGDGTYEYITPTEDKALWFDTSKPHGKYDFMIFRKTGDSYMASINW